MASLMLHGSGWAQRWGIVPGMEEQARPQIGQAGTDTAGNLTVVDPGSDNEAALVVAWALVAAAVVQAGDRWRWAAWRSECVRGAVTAAWFPDEGAARDAARRVQHACAALGP